ncbi:MAG: hypothetical protein HYY98_17120 [Burkholderiales bacterium]|nr:hypothetical protein [Burkholderiales bacterium]
MATIYTLALLIIAAVSALGVLHPRYEDTLLQRVGMAVACLGAVAELAALASGYDRINAHITTSTGAALFALGTMLKKWRGPRMGRRRTDKHARQGRHPC